jgi:hypothetical protein
MYRGDLVEARSPSAILATLDETGAMAGLPFIPEYCGQGFKVNRRVDKVCDTVMYSGSRFIPDAVLLDDVRCDRSGDSC